MTSLDKLNNNAKHYIREGKRNEKNCIIYWYLFAESFARWQQEYGIGNDAHLSRLQKVPLGGIANDCGSERRAEGSLFCLHLLRSLLNAANIHYRRYAI